MTDLFTVFDKPKQTEIFANYLPSDDIFAGKICEDTTLYKFLFGFAETFRRVNDSLEIAFDEYDLRTTTEFINEWESALGIPDDCFPGTGTIAERQRDVFAKFIADGTQTAEDFIALAALYNIVITIEDGLSAFGTFDFTWDITFQDVTQARFTMIVFFDAPATLQFPLTFPIPFSDQNIDKLKCLFRKLAPANVDVIFVENP